MIQYLRGQGNAAGRSEHHATDCIEDHHDAKAIKWGGEITVGLWS